MSGLEGQRVTHDVTERLSYWLFSSILKKRPNFKSAQNQMKETCMKCHLSSLVNKFYAEAEDVLKDINKKIKEAQMIIDRLKKKKLLTPEPFDEEIDFIAFDLWHYYGRTAKHGAFMGGADFVQWHGNYEILHLMIKFKKLAKELESKKKY